MALRSAVASAAVSREVGRGGHRLGAFSFCCSPAGSGRSRILRLDPRLRRGTPLKASASPPHPSRRGFCTADRGRLAYGEATCLDGASSRRNDLDLERDCGCARLTALAGTVPLRILGACAASSRSRARWCSSTRCCSARSRRSSRPTPSEYDLSKAEAGLLLGAFGAGAIVGGIRVGCLIAMRIGQRSAALGGLVVLAIASVVFATAGGAGRARHRTVPAGLASAATFAGALAWLTIGVPARAARADDRDSRSGGRRGARRRAAVRGRRRSRRHPRQPSHGRGRPARACALGSRVPRRPAARPRRPARCARALARPGVSRRSLAQPVPVVLLQHADPARAALGLATRATPCSRSRPSSSSRGWPRSASTRSLGRHSDRAGRLAPIRLALVASLLVVARARAVETAARRHRALRSSPSLAYRRPLHAGHGARRRPCRGRGPVAGAGVRVDRLRLGDGEARRPRAGRRARRRRRVTPPRTSSRRVLCALHPRRRRSWSRLAAARADVS